MKSRDARLWLNQKNSNKRITLGINSAKQRRNLYFSAQRDAFDARNVLDSRRNNIKDGSLSDPFWPIKSVYKVENFRRKPAQNFQRVVGKHVEVSNDGNIKITSRTNSVATRKKERGVPFTTNIVVTQQERFKKKPLFSQVDNLEEMSLDDLPDVKTVIPRGILSSKASPLRRTASHTSLADQMLSMRNSMVADYSSPNPLPQSYKVAVTNLSESVSKQDVIELFAHIGAIKSAEMTQLGSAVVEFFSGQDAVQACDIYHNRLLDGQPMQCSIRPNQLSTKTSITQRLGARVQCQNVSSHQPIFSTAKPLVSSSPTSHFRPVRPSLYRYDNRNVQFTVKLP